MARAERRSPCDFRIFGDYDPVHRVWSYMIAEDRGQEKPPWERALWAWTVLDGDLPPEIMNQIADELMQGAA